MNSFNEETFPYDLLAGFGLTQEMIDDLPGHVLETIGNGGRSPLLPIEIPTKFGSVSAYTKFRISDTITENGKCGIVFYPQLMKADLCMFNEKEQELLLEGRTILADIDIAAKEGEQKHKEKCFVQIDKDTNHVFYVHSAVVGRNLKGVDSVVDLSNEDIEKLSNGELITVTEPAYMTIGIDIFSETGIFVCPGDEESWKSLVGKQMEKYNFGIYGCWINENGVLRYVKEEDFDEPILEAQKNVAKEESEKEKEHTRTATMEQQRQNDQTREQEVNPQITR